MPDRKSLPRHLSVPKCSYQKGWHSSEKTKELLRFEVNGCELSCSSVVSLELGAHLQECRLLLHDAHQQRVNVVLEVFDLWLQLLQLYLPLCQQQFLTLKLHLLPLQLSLALDQQGDQLAVSQVVVRARSFCQRLRRKKNRK